VARELGVTKPALYRHFRSKDELLHAMEADYATRLLDFVVRPLRARTAASGDATTGGQGADAAYERHLEDVVRLYLSSVFAFFDEHPFHYLFYVRTILGRRRSTTGPVGDALREHDALLLQLVDRPGSAIPEECLLTVARYLATSAAFWTTEHYRRSIGRPPAPGQTFEPEAVQLSRDEQQHLIEHGVRHVLHGFLASAADVDREAVERIAWIQPAEVRERPRVLDAITRTVLEVGYGAATVERIADRAGLSKSGLYHYFRNRDHMLAETLIDGQRHFASLARTRFGQLGTHAERLYGLFVMISSYAHHEPSAVIVENWLRESNIEVQIPGDHVVELQRIYAFVSEMLVEGQLAGDPENGFAILTFINFLVMQELGNLDVRTARPDRLVDRIRGLFHLFADGAIPTLESNGADS
tara:strand:- start:303 stop:1544 length:1242 start_codon:yes stop_codon:yes gene_type:complete